MHEYTIHPISAVRTTSLSAQPLSMKTNVTKLILKTQKQVYVVNTI